MNSKWDDTDDDLFFEDLNSSENHGKDNYGTNAHLNQTDSELESSNRFKSDFRSKLLQTLVRSDKSSKNVHEMPSEHFRTPYPTPVIAKSTTINDQKSFLKGPHIKKRKFPGPAGLLPILPEDISEVVLAPKRGDEELSEKICSQSSVQNFNEGPWTRMLKDHFSDDSHSILNNINIKSVLRRSVLTGHTFKKVPFLAVMIRAINYNNKDASATFQDRSGEMDGIISSDVLEKYLNIITSGSVLVMKNVTVLCPGSFKLNFGIRGQKNNYLNITLNSIATIYSVDENGSVMIKQISPFKCPLSLSDLFDGKDNTLSKTVIEEEEDSELEKRLNYNKIIHSPSSISNVPPFRKPFLNHISQASSTKENIHSNFSNNVESCSNLQSIFINPSAKRLKSSNLSSNNSKSSENALSASVSKANKNTSLSNQQQFSVSFKKLNNFEQQKCPSVEKYSIPDDDLDLLIANIDTESL